MLALTWQPGGCLWALSANEQDLPGLPEDLKNILLLSDLSLIQSTAEAATAPPSALGTEPEHGYCYYFQKVSLALQQQNVEQAFALAQEADKKQLAPVISRDWLPLIKASVLRTSRIWHARF